MFSGSSIWPCHSLWARNFVQKKWLGATLDKGPRTKSPGTTLKQFEPWIEPFFTFKNIKISKVQWVSLKTWGPIWGSNIKNVWLTCERIRLTFVVFVIYPVWVLSTSTIQKFWAKIPQEWGMKITYKTGGKRLSRHLVAGFVHRKQVSHCPYITFNLLKLVSIWCFLVDAVVHLDCFLMLQDTKMAVLMPATNAI
jgi:hypothetical protein